MRQIRPLVSPNYLFDWYASCFVGQGKWRHRRGHRSFTRIVTTRVRAFDAGGDS